MTADLEFTYAMQPLGTEEQAIATFAPRIDGAELLPLFDARRSFWHPTARDCGRRGISRMAN